MWHTETVIKEGPLGKSWQFGHENERKNQVMSDRNLASHIQHCVIGEADPFIARLLQRFAEKRGLQVVAAQRGEEVVDFAQSTKPVVIILEPELPGKVRGWEAVRVLRNNRETETIPVIACTWLKEPDAQARIGALVAYLQKPDLHYEDFVAALEAAHISTTAVLQDEVD